jgi:glycosyltransferase involved in cell wall biosynthesis
VRDGHGDSTGLSRASIADRVNTSEGATVVIKLLLATRDFPAAAGDVSFWWLELARRLAPRCDDFAVVCWGAARRLPDAPFEVIRMGAPRASGHAWRPGRFDAVLGADWASVVPALAWRGRARTTRVFAAAFGPELARGPACRPLGALARRSRLAVLSRCDGVLAATPSAQSLLAARGLSSVVVPGAVDAQRFRPAPRGALARELGLVGRRVLLAVGPLLPERHAERVMYAVSALGVRYPELRYVLAGDGPERGPLELLAERLRIAHKVRFLGEVGTEALPAVYNLADVVVQLGGDAAALVDASGSVPLEALASAKPVVLAQGSSLTELVDEQTGRRVPDGDGSALTAALCELLDQPALARELGACGRERVLLHATWEHAAERCRDALVLARPNERVARPRRAQAEPLPRPQRSAAGAGIAR